MDKILEGNNICVSRKQVIIINPIPMKEKMLGTTLNLSYGPLYLSESLIRHGYTPHIIYTDNNETIKKVGALVSGQTLCFGISTMSGTQLSNAIDIATILKAKYPRIPLIWGGCMLLRYQSKLLIVI